MKRLLLVVLASAAPAWAQWTQIGGDDAKALTYADPGTIRRQDHVATMAILVDFKNPQRAPYGPEYLSQKMQQEFDCDARRTKVLERASYAGQMGAEDMVAMHEQAEDWTAVTAGSAAEELWTIACGKRAQ